MEIGGQSGGFDHIDGIDHYNGFVFAGLHSTSNPTPGIIGVFRADFLEYVSHSVLTNGEPEGLTMTVSTYSTTPKEIYVDNRFNGTGKPQDPFATIGEALGIAWDGSILMINGEGGTYPETAVTGERIEMRAHGAAPAVIGR